MGWLAGNCLAERYARMMHIRLKRMTIWIGTETSSDIFTLKTISLRCYLSNKKTHHSWIEHWLTSYHIQAPGG